MSDEQTPSQYLTDFLLEKIGEQPVAARIRLYRALAVKTEDHALAVNCRRLASGLARLQRQHEQLHLSFKRRTHG